MTRRTVTPRGFDYRDPPTAARLDLIGIPGTLAVALAAINVPISLVERFHHTDAGWDYLRSLLPTPGLTCSEDMAALITFVNMGTDRRRINEWARIGPLKPALRLHLKNVPVETVAAFPLTPAHGLDAFVRMLQAITSTGIHIDDILLWHTGGVLSLTPPFLIERNWAPWRSAAVHHLGMSSAALAAAAGLSVEEAVAQHAAGNFNHATLKMMASLRSGRL